MKKVFVVVLAFVCAASLAEEKAEEAAAPVADGERPKTFKRLIPADVLRGKLVEKDFCNFLEALQDFVFKCFAENFYLLGYLKLNVF